MQNDSRQRGLSPVQPSRGHSTPLPIVAVALGSSGFWGSRQQKNSEITISHCLEWMKKSGWLHNFESAIDGHLLERRRGRIFTDADVYKLLEAMCWDYARTGDEVVNDTIISLIGVIGACQEPDGYLNTGFGRQSQEPRYSDLEWGHELYNYGHLLQAAVARIRSVGEDELVTIARRAADHVCHIFGADGLNLVCGHPGIETALVEFSRATGDVRYLNQAKIFLERRGTGTLGEIEFGAEYFQDDMPIREATVFRGHAVRAVYLAAGAVDAAVESGDEESLQAIKSQYQRTISKRTYVTGGMGSRYQDEAFGEDYELPSDGAYCETCAGVGLVMLNWRLLLETGEPHYADMIEHVLHNVVATSPSRDGSKFFYANTLHQRTPGTAPSDSEPTPRASSSQRAPWFEVSCCPSNLARLFASISGYVASSRENTVFLHLLTQGEISTNLESGFFGMKVETDYPREGMIRINVVDAPGSAEIAIRIPSWSQQATISVNGKPRKAKPGYERVSVQAGDYVELNLLLEPRFCWPHPMIDGTRHTVAVKKGPLIYCVEFPSDSGISVDMVRVNAAIPPAERDGELSVSGWLSSASDDHTLYGDAPMDEPLSHEQLFRLSPYFDWGEEGPGTMRVWLPLGRSA